MSFYHLFSISLRVWVELGRDCFFFPITIYYHLPITILLSYFRWLLGMEIDLRYAKIFFYPKFRSWLSRVSTPIFLPWPG